MSEPGRPGHAPARSLLDRVIYAFITRGWDQKAISSYHDQVQRYDALLSPEQHDAFALIDAKATGLLTHVSLMIAGLGLIAPLVADSEFEVTVVVCEIGVYLLIAVGCLRCLSVFHAREFRQTEDNLRAIIAHEFIIRRELYALCSRSAIAFTLAVFLILPVLYFWKPGKYPL